MFLDASRVLQVQNGQMVLGGQQITTTPALVDNGDFVGVFTLQESIIVTLSEGSMAALRTSTSIRSQRSATAAASRAIESPSVRSIGAIVADPPAA